MHSSQATFRTDPYFGLEDRWLETGADEVTHYHAAGEGMPIVLLHGSGLGVTAAANWWLNIPSLAQTGKCIAIDLAGFGQTIVSSGTTFGIREWGDHVVRVLDTLGIERAWFVGNSLGGWVALQLALDAPERVLGIVSMGTGGAALTRALKGHSQPDLSFEGIRKSLEQFVVDPTVVTPELVRVRHQRAIEDWNGGHHQEVIAARDRDREALPLDLDRLAGSTMPMLLVHGLQDSVIPVARTHELLNKIPSADALLLNRCGHWSQVERHGDFNRAVRSYLSDR